MWAWRCKPLVSLPSCEGSGTWLNGGGSARSSYDTRESRDGRADGGVNSVNIRSRATTTVEVIPAATERAPTATGGAPTRTSPVGAGAIAVREQVLVTGKAVVTMLRCPPLVLRAQPMQTRQTQQHHPPRQQRCQARVLMPRAAGSPDFMEGKSAEQMLEVRSAAVAISVVVMWASMLLLWWLLLQ